MQHGVRTGSKFVVNRILNVTQGHKRRDQQNFKSRLLKKVSPDFKENTEVYTTFYALSIKKGRSDWMILKPDVISQTGSALKTSVFGLN